MSARQVIIRFIWVSALYYGLLFGGFVFTGAGHGSDFFSAAVNAPFPLPEVHLPAGLLFWPAVAVFVALRRFVLCRAAAAGALIWHYWGVYIVFLETDWYYVRRVWQAMPLLVIMFASAYAGSQAFMWWCIAHGEPRRLTSGCSEPDDSVSVAGRTPASPGR